jgi:hypothetical protein
MSASLILRTVKGTPLTNLEVDNNFSNLNIYSGEVDANIGVLSALTTSATSNIVFAVNELVTSNTATNARITTTNSNLANTDSNVSTVSSSLTTTNTNLSTTNSNIGVLTNLTTTTKDNVVNAINEIKGGNLSQFAATTSAELAAVISNETGTGSLVFATSPTLAGTATANSLTLSNVLTTKKIVESVVTIGNTGTATNIDLSLGTVFTATLTGSATLTIINTGTVSSFTLILTNDATAGRSVAFASSGGTFKYPGGAASLSRTTTANAIDVWFFMTPDSGTTWYGSQPMKNLTT